MTIKNTTTLGGTASNVKVGKVAVSVVLPHPVENWINTDVSSSMVS
jgi:hypothetical protein